MKKILVIILILIFILMLAIPLYSNASTDLGLSLDNYNGKNLKDPNEKNSDSKAKGMIEKILGVIRTIGTMLSVIIIMMIGIKFMLGSPEEKFEYKQSMKLYLMGSFLLFAFSWIPQLIYDFAKAF